MQAKIKRVYDIYVNDVDGNRYLTTLPTQESVEKFATDWFSETIFDKDELEVKTMWRKYHESL